MLKYLTASELAEWQAFATLEPFETEKSDYKMSYMASLLTNLTIRTYGKQGAKLTSLADFELKWDPAEQGTKVQTIEQMKEVFNALVSADKESKERENKRLRRRPKHLKK